MEITSFQAHESNSKNKNFELHNSTHMEMRLKEYQDRQLKELRLEMLNMIKSLKSEIEQKFVNEVETFTENSE